MQRKTRGRDVHGILLLDKPLAMGSNEVLQQVKRLFAARKAGHTGSLDNLATGMLPLCLGEATKIAGFLLDADKHYQVTCTLGVTTTTADAEGEVISTQPVEGLDRKQVEAALSRFVGTIEQIPPMYSALKRQGQPLYKLARQGIVVERAARHITIYELVLHRVALPEIDLEVRCSKGTYIRTLAEDIGQVLGCGAYVSALRRLGVGVYTDPGAMVSLAALQARHDQFGPESLDDFLLPPDSALSHWPEIHLNETLTAYVRNGQPVQMPRAPTSGLVRLYEGRERFLGVGEIQDDGRIGPKRLLG